MVCIESAGDTRAVSNMKNNKSNSYITLPYYVFIHLTTMFDITELVISVRNNEYNVS